MIILLYGEDTYRAKEKLKEIMEEHKKKHASGLNLKYLEGKGTSFDDLRNEMLGISMFKEKKLIVLLDAFLNNKLKEDLLEKGKVFADSENVLLLFEKQNILKKEKLLSFVEKNGKLQDFKLLEGVALKKWAKDMIESRGGEITEKALTLLVSSVGGDLWRMSNEIIKLANYNKKITEKEVSLLVKETTETNIFDTVDAIAVKDKKKALELINNHINKGDSAIFLLAMIASQIRNIISVKDLKEKIAMNPFVMRKSKQQANNFSLEDLKIIYSRILELDSDIKVGRIDQNIALDILISEI